MIDLARRAALTGILVFACATGVTRAQMPGGGGQMPPGMPGGAPAGMPDARMMSGIPMPMGDLPEGTVSVRLVRGAVSNVLAGQAVELLVGGQSRTAQTDEAGRAQFGGIAAGANVKAVATIDGERLESQPFTIPEKGGVRLMLVASSVSGDAAPVAGTITFSGDSRVALEFDDDALSVFYLLEIVNNGKAPIIPATPLVLDLPDDATNASLIEGSSPQAQVKGRRVSIAGPIKPGRTTAQIGYQLPPSGGSRTIVQAFPATFDSLSIAVQKAGALQVKCAQLSRQQEVSAEGKVYVFGIGPALAAGRPLAIELSGLPHHTAWPRNIALALAVLILGAGAWAAFRGAPDGAAARRRELQARRDGLFAELLRVEQARREGTMEPEAYAERRAELVETLERIYGELDSAPPAGPAPGGDRGIAA